MVNLWYHEIDELISFHLEGWIIWAVNDDKAVENVTGMK